MSFKKRTTISPHLRAVNARVCRRFNSGEKGDKIHSSGTHTIAEKAHCGNNKRFFLNAREIKSDSENMKKRHDSFVPAAAY